MRARSLRRSSRSSSADDLDLGSLSRQKNPETDAPPSPKGEPGGGGGLSFSFYREENDGAKNGEGQRGRGKPKRSVGKPPSGPGKGPEARVARVGPRDRRRGRRPRRPRADGPRPQQPPLEPPRGLQQPAPAPGGVHHLQEVVEVPRDEPEQARRERPADAAEREAQERKREVERADRHEAHHGRRLVGMVPRVDVEEHEDQGGTEGADVEGQEGDGGEQRHRRAADQEHEGDVRVGGGAAAEDAFFEGPPVLHEPDRLDEPGEGERPEEEEGGDEAPELGGLRERGVERSEAGGGGGSERRAHERAASIDPGSNAFRFRLVFPSPLVLLLPPLPPSLKQKPTCSCPTTLGHSSSSR